jgi:hypothetical protein
LKSAGLLAALTLANCDVTHTLQAVSAAQTGCAPQDIEITDDEAGFNSRSWVAWCNSERYQCFGAGNTATCKSLAPKVEPRASAQTAEAPVRRVVPAWVDHELAACGVSAKFLGVPKDELHDVQTKVGLLKMTVATFELAGGKGALALSCSPEVRKKTTPVAGVLDGARDGMLQNIGAKLSDEREIIGGREVLFELGGEQGLAHLLWVNNRVVIATAMPLSTVGSVSAKRFVNSVQMSEER